MKEVAFELLLREFGKLVERWGSVSVMMNSISKNRKEHTSLVKNGYKTELLLI